MVSSDTPEFLTDAEVADLLRLSVRTIRGWRLNNEGPPSLKVGGAVRYRRADVDAWLEKRRVSS